MKLKFTNEGANPVKVLKRVPYGHGVDELHSESTEFEESFVQPGESVVLEGDFKLIEMTPTTPGQPGDAAMYVGGA